MVIDSHTHVGSVSYGSAEGIWTNNTDDPANIEVNYKLREEIMDQNDIDAAVIMPSFSFKKTEGIKSYQKLNDRLADIFHAHDRFVAALGAVPLDHGTNQILTEVERLAEMDLKGISWHHRFQGGPIDHPNTMAVLDRLEALDLVTFIHCNTPISNLESLDRLEKVIGYTDQPVVVLDATNQIDNIEKLITIGKKYDNLYVDMGCMFSIMQPIEQLVTELGAEHVIFGTNFYAEPLAYNYSADLFQIRKADITEEERRLILEENIIRLLEL